MGYVLLIAAVLLFVVSLPRRALNGPGFLLFRALFPSWRFFDDVGETACLMFRMGGPGGESFGPWLECLQPPRRGPLSFLFNPEGNLSAACHSLVEQLVQELEELTAEGATGIERSVSYRLVESLVRHRIVKLSADAIGTRFQFKLSDAATGDFLVSPVREL